MHGVKIYTGVSNSDKKYINRTSALNTPIINRFYSPPKGVNLINEDLGNADGITCSSRI